MRQDPLPVKCKREKYCKHSPYVELLISHMVIIFVSLLIFSTSPCFSQLCHVLLFWRHYF